MNWRQHAHRLADQVTHPGSRWREAVAETPRHLLVPAWWRPGAEGWTACRGSSDEEGWLRHTYADQTLVTRIGELHADDAAEGRVARGRPTSSSTLPGLVLRMFRHARIGPGDRVLDVGTGSGYGAALLCRLLGDDRVTTIDVERRLVDVAAERLADLGHRPRLVNADATTPLPGEYDRIVATVAVRPIPAAWLAALPTGGRFATTITNTSLIVTGVKTPDGGAAGLVERDWAMFMTTRTGTDYPPLMAGQVAAARVAEGEEVTTARFPILNLLDAWEIRSMLEVNVPDVEHVHTEEGDVRTAVMVHEDGSWARAESVGGAPATVHQGGPRRLWDELDRVRDHWLRHSALPLYGAEVTVSPDGTIHLRRERWSATIG
ncbi:methyltransferase domain-containing protein [Herbidospora galbida]|uniref:Protein-L-isoaspartate O-methyltransferase n=1 Tax=Herbidospora galbida TaxID=2575442 RepID=A0A4U3MJ21_9ACTN|nr:methyltransferase domain-containing protein [Herbidospora galbida]TKK88006.1 methyltransferase domain-containing protein [Herbidospora galbida]